MNEKVLVPLRDAQGGLFIPDKESVDALINIRRLFTCLLFAQIIKKKKIV